MTDPDLLFTAKIRNLTENELVVFFVCSVFYQIIFRANMIRLKLNKNNQLYILGCKIGCLFYNLLIFSVYCGERGIRTPGTSQYNGFQDRRNRPLCHLS